MPKSKKNGGPYPTHIKKTRRDEVFRLHFDYGYSARKIAEMMNVSRNTVNADIDYWYTKLEQELSSIAPEANMAKLVNRLEVQRNRLREELDKTKDFQEKVSINKMLLDIDSRMIQFSLKIKTSEKTVYDLATRRLNDWMKEEKYDHRFMLIGSLFDFSPSTFEKIMKIINEDKVQIKHH